jgi:hypothetical protein
VIPTLDVKDGGEPWKVKREQFVRNVRMAKSSSNDVQSSRVRGGVADTSDLTPCPHCDRSFNELAAERHIPICKESHDRNRMRTSSKRVDPKREARDEALRRRIAFDPRKPSSEKSSKTSSMESVEPAAPKQKSTAQQSTKTKGVHCGECGSQFATERARFCVECGFKRK